MSERDGLLAAIAAQPEDDTPRLILADWLDEHDDPLGEFIRLQMELEPLRVPRAEPMEELIRVRCLNRIPPGKELEDDTWEVARQLARESELLRAHQAAWLGEAAELAEDYANLFEPELRRGFVASAGIGLTALSRAGMKLRRGCPALQRLIVFGTLGRGEELAGCRALDGLPELVVAGWLRPDDAAALAVSPHVRSLRSLTVWIGNEGDEEAVRTLARLSSLRELTLIQLHGGLDSSDPEELDRRADYRAACFRQLRPDCTVRVERPFRRRFPLDGVHIGRGIDAGHLPDGKAVLVEESRQPVIIYFDAEGRLEREERLDLRDRLTRPPRYSWEDCNTDELVEVLGREIGFRPGPIFVREFFAEEADVGVLCWGVHEEEIHTPTTPDPVEGEEIGRSLHWWQSTGQFCLPFGNHYWADGLGRVHSS